MAISFRSIVLCFITSLVLPASAQTCSNYTFSTNRVFSSCSNLPYLDAHLHWNYIASTKKIEIAYRAPQTSNGWIAWGINPTGTGMAGSQAIVAFRHSNGSLVAYPTQLTSYKPSMQPGTLSFPVSNINTEYSNNEMAIFAVVGPLSNSTTVNHVWQAGTSVSNDVPQMHPTSGANVQSHGALDFLSG
ncbi:DOMON domain [Macleaya cordata]|uniref:DOMON domain n=1 Tax=Macleaya cordata TaxID=56857 RepID=A0A200QXF4_MACCD|nr:DOMON domain [Macleaya cordata]OVA15125.1 DOMON domain [Macleaya cordata]